jgi:hypothetical protein
MSYILSLFEKGKEVHTSRVEKMIGATDYPEVGQTIEGTTWKVIGVILQTETELRLRVERVK